MKSQRYVKELVIAVAGLVLALAPAAQAMEFVTIGNPGNPADTTGDPNPCGAVAYEYKIGKYEVTWTQYADFLNAVAATDTYALYNAEMGTDAADGGITQSGAPGSYTYSVKAGFENRPVAFICWYDCLRFANWMTSGATESGSYTITGGGPNSGAVTIPDAAQRAAWAAAGQYHVLLPSEDEWYKAAYYDGAAYWDYPNGANTAPTAAAPPGLGASPGSAAYEFAVGATTDVGAYSAWPTDSPYGTYDQAGNVWEWNEALIGATRGVRGGAYGNGAVCASASYRGLHLLIPYDPTFEDPGWGAVGFRVAAVGTVAPTTTTAAAQTTTTVSGTTTTAMPTTTTVAQTTTTAAPAAQAMEFVTIGNPGNPADTTGDPNPCGAVAYEYKIGKYEVTWTQYADFLNAVAATDTYALYNAEMGTDAADGGITQSGAPGSYTYSVKAGFENRPVAFICWYDCLRFANWMTSGATESGSYTITGGGPNSGAVTIPDAAQRAAWAAAGQYHVLLPSEDEWYKAAYYDGAAYWDYPNGANTAPTAAAPPGLGASPGSAAYESAVGATTDVGAYSAWPTDSPYGTYDQAGNVWEWNEALIGATRGVRGGAYGNGAVCASASYRGLHLLIPYDPTFEDPGWGAVGFRVAAVGTSGGATGTLIIGR